MKLAPFMICLLSGTVTFSECYLGQTSETLQTEVTPRAHIHEMHKGNGTESNLTGMGPNAGQSATEKTAKAGAALQPGEDEGAQAASITTPELYPELQEGIVTHIATFTETLQEAGMTVNMVDPHYVKAVTKGGRAEKRGITTCMLLTRVLQPGKSDFEDVTDKDLYVTDEHLESADLPTKKAVTFEFQDLCARSHTVTLATFTEKELRDHIGISFNKKTPHYVKMVMPGGHAHRKGVTDCMQLNAVVFEKTGLYVNLTQARLDDKHWKGQEVTFHFRTVASVEFSCSALQDRFHAKIDRGDQKLKDFKNLFPYDATGFNGISDEKFTQGVMQGMQLTSILQKDKSRPYNFAKLHALKNSEFKEWKKAENCPLTLVFTGAKKVEYKKEETSSSLGMDFTETIPQEVTGVIQGPAKRKNVSAGWILEGVSLSRKDLTREYLPEDDLKNWEPQGLQTLELQDTCTSATDPAKTEDGATTVTFKMGEPTWDWDCLGMKISLEPPHFVETVTPGGAAERKNVTRCMLLTTIVKNGRNNRVASKSLEMEAFHARPLTLIFHKDQEGAQEAEKRELRDLKDDKKLREKAGELGITPHQIIEESMKKGVDNQNATINLILEAKYDMNVKCPPPASSQKARASSQVAPGKFLYGDQRAPPDTRLEQARRLELNKIPMEQEQRGAEPLVLPITEPLGVNDLSNRRDQVAKFREEQLGAAE
mmetsp:Transcript_7828/g.14223  ORF Transcript_7828/g.14223 Transcript_7828/m.14223 type:complete len:711 (-) Transcript_7828:114-2246(-)